MKHAKLIIESLRAVVELNSQKAQLEQAHAANLKKINERLNLAQSKLSAIISIATQEPE